ncbi:AMP-binding protein [Thalassospira lucentensis]|uniref:AMP-binding protein n=1 Tax=Thalassospira lucentensis TaxID=168935 RepID=UPI003AA842B4
MDETLRHRIFYALRVRNDRPVLSVAGRLARKGPSCLTGEDLRSSALALAGQLRLALDEKPQVVVLALPPSIPFVTALFASLFCGICAVPVALPRVGGMTDRFARMVTDCGASAILCDASDKPQISAALKDIPSSKRPTLWAIEDLPSAPAMTEPLPLLSGAPPITDHDYGQPPSSQYVPPVIIQYTSGSSRFPRGVALPGHAILANSALVASHWGLNAKTVAVNWLPYHHDMGLMGGLFYPLLEGGQVVQLNPLEVIQRPLRWLQTVSSFGGTLSGGPTFAFARCIDHIDDADCNGLDLSSWAQSYCGAEPVPEIVLQRFREKFAPYGLRSSSVFACYGMAEYTLFSAGKPGDIKATSRQKHIGELDIAPCAMGSVLRRSLCIVDPETGRPVDDGQQGEVWLTGPSKTNGYVNAPQETAALFDARLSEDDENRSWLRTGDLATIRNDALYVAGRIKDTLIAHGQKVAAPEVEWLAAKQHPDLNPAAAAAFMASAIATEQAILIIEWRSKKAPSVDLHALAQTIRHVVLGEWGLSLGKISFVPRGSLPRTTSGKIRRSIVANEHYSRTSHG